LQEFNLVKSYNASDMVPRQSRFIQRVNKFQDNIIRPDVNTVICHEGQSTEEEK